MKMHSTDYIVVGGGIAGLSFALEAANYGRVTLVSKAPPFTSNTSRAQGGIAAAIAADDSWELHYEDTLICGEYKSETEVAEAYTKAAPLAISELIASGCRFERRTDGKIDMAREAGHSRSRSVNAGDYTGREIITALWAKVLKTPNIKYCTGYFATELLMTKHEGRQLCTGIRGADVNTGNSRLYLAKAVILCTGGTGRVYIHTSNSPGTTGDGIAMASRAGVKLRDMQRIQFHPTAITLPGRDAILITEAARGLGGIIRNANGNTFLHKYHPDAELAPRNVVSRAIYAETANNESKEVYLDMTGIPVSTLQKKLPGVFRTCLEAGIDPKKDYIPVNPVAHYINGGIATDVNGATSLPGLFAAGEAACTGFHGTNRLAGNSLLEGWETGKRAFRQAYKECVTPVVQFQGRPENKHVQCNFCEESLRNLMWKYAGINRQASGLKKLMEQLKTFQRKVKKGEKIPFSMHEWEKYNMLRAAQKITVAALAESESIAGDAVKPDYERSGV